MICRSRREEAHSLPAKNSEPPHGGSYKIADPSFLLGYEPGENLAHLAGELPRVNGLREIIVVAGLERGFAASGSVVTGDGYNRNLTAVRMALEFVRQFLSVHDGHADVRQNEVRGGAYDRRNRAEGMLGFVHLVAGLFQQGRKQFEDLRVIVND